MASSTFPNRPFDLVEATSSTQSTANNTSTITWSLTIKKNSTSPTFSGNCPAYADFYLEGVMVARRGQDNQDCGFDFRGSGPWTILSGTNTYTHDGNGNRYLDIYGYANYDILGATKVETGYWLPRIPQAPGAPGTPTISNVTPTSLTVTWTAASRGHADIDLYSPWIATNSGFTANASYVQVSGSTRSYTFTGLTPGQTYYFRINAHNGDGWGAFSGTASTQLPVATAPGVTYTLPADGTRINISLTPPGGSAGVTNYTVEFRPLNGTATSLTLNSTSFTYGPSDNVVAGGTYQFRASAWIGTYQSPWSSWTTVTTPRPNTTPGDYFDGATTPPASSDVTYSWTGTAHASASRANGVTPLGWNTNIATAVLQRVRGGTGGSYAARLTFLADATASGSYVGMVNSAGQDAEVVPQAVYNGSIYVSVSRTQRLALQLYWLTSSHGGLSAVTSSATVVNPGSVVRLTTGALTAPTGAAYAILRVMDVSGTSWSTWKGGDWLQVDSAMITLGTNLYPYFDGSWSDDGTYAYSWDGTSHQSRSYRQLLSTLSSYGGMVGNTEQETAAIISLIDPNCPTPPTPPSPPTIPTSCIDETGIWYRYWLPVPATEVSRWSKMIPSVQVRTKTKPLTQVRVRYWENADGSPYTEIPDSAWMAEQVVSYVPAQTVLTLDALQRGAYASVNNSSNVDANHLLYGSGGKPASWPTLECGISHLISFDVPTDNTVEPGMFTLTLTQGYY